MAFEPKDVKSADDHWKGPWGEISTSEVRCIHFVRENHRVEEIWTYPYDALLRWVY